MQIGNKFTEGEIICIEDNCLSSKIITSYRMVSYLLHFLFSFQYAVFSLILYCTDEAKRPVTRIQLIKSYYVTVVFLAQ